SVSLLSRAGVDNAGRSSVEIETPMRVLDSIVLVTAANRGIGRQVVAGLLKRGARRVYVAMRSAALGPIVALDPARVVALLVDITNRFEVEAAGRPAPDLTPLINDVGVATLG